jgi:uncharacterized protein YyaL (SSP411 family)
MAGAAFEKMLYDNAQILELLIHGWQETRSPLFAQRIRETCDWALAEMKAAPSSSGTRAFAASWDADSEGEEGRFYVWSADAIDRLVDADAELFKTVYDVTPDGNWEGHNILNRRHSPAPARCRHRDEAHRSARDPERRARETRQTRFRRQGAGRLERADDRGARQRRRSLLRAALADCGALGLRLRLPRDAARRTAAAQLARGQRAPCRDARRLCADDPGRARAQQATGDDTFLAQARRWTNIVDTHYWDETNGGYYFTADDAETLIVRSKSAFDGATPNGSGPCCRTWRGFII